MEDDVDIISMSYPSDETQLGESDQIVEYS